jgi:hypothetical protein
LGIGQCAFAEEPKSATVLVPTPLEKIAPDEPAFLPIATLLNEKKPPVPANLRPRTGHIEVRGFKRLYWSSSKGNFRSEGNATLQYTPLQKPNEPPPVIDPTSRLTAKEVEYNTQTGYVQAREGVLMKTPDGIFTGSNVFFNFTTKEGTLEKATLETVFFKMKGEKIEAKLNGSYTLTRGEFTTCEHGKPDYRVRAKSLTATPGKYIVAKNITLFAGKTALFTLPVYRQSLQGRSQALPFTYTYNRVEGAGIRVIQSPIKEPYRSLDLDLAFSMKGTPIGFVYFQQELNRTPGKQLPTFSQTTDLVEPQRSILDMLSPPVFQNYTETRLNDDYSPRTTAYLALQNRQFSFTRLPFASLLTRLPEIGLRFDNILGRSPKPPQPGSEEELIRSTNAGSLLQKMPRAPFLLDANLSLSHVFERPTMIGSKRLNLRLQAATQPLLLAPKTALRFGLSNWTSFYTQSSTLYNLISPEFDLNYTPTSTSLFGIGYRYATDMGRTPFLFDRRDLRHELRFRYQVGGPWGFGYQLRYDLRNMRPFNSEFAVVRNFDCLQLGFVYRTYASQLGLIINYIPPSPKQLGERRKEIEKKTPALPPINEPQLTLAPEVLQD